MCHRLKPAQRTLYLGECAMIRVVGMVLLVLGSSLFGFGKAWELKERVRELQEIQTALLKIETAVCRFSLPLCEAFRQAGADIPLFSEAATFMEEGALAKEAFDRALDGYLPTSHLVGADVALLERFRDGLSAPDTDGQTKNFAIVKADLARQIESASEAEEKQGRLYRSGGVLAGLMLGLILW